MELITFVFSARFPGVSPWTFSSRRAGASVTVQTPKTNTKHVVVKSSCDFYSIRKRFRSSSFVYKHMYNTVRKRNTIVCVFGRVVKKKV